MVASQLKILMPVGTAIAMVDSTKNVFAAGAHADREHVVRPDAHADESDADRCRHHHRVAENRFAGKHGNDFGSECEGGNDQDIDFGVAEDPEEVHPDHGRAAGLRVEEMPPR